MTLPTPTQEYPSDILDAADDALGQWTIDDGSVFQFEQCRNSVAAAILAERQRDRWKPIEEAEAGRCLMWVANGGLHGKGHVSFGNVFVYEDHRTYRPDGHRGSWNVTHYMTIPTMSKGGE